MRARASRPEFFQMDKIKSEIEKLRRGRRRARIIYIAPRAVWQIISYLAQARPQLYEGFFIPVTKLNQ